MNSSILRLEFGFLPSFSDMEFLNAILVEVSGQKLEFSPTRVSVTFPINSSFLVSRIFCKDY
jgi:hypothetical protein